MASAPLDMEGAKFGLINSLRTGSPVYDAMIAMIIPLVFKLLFDGASTLSPGLQKVAEKVKSLCRKVPEDKYQRVIEVEQMRRNDGYLYTPHSNDRTSVLLKALQLYIASKCLQYKQCAMTLEDHYENVEIEDDDDDDDDGEPERNTEIGFLKTYFRITQSPPEDQWIEIEPGLEFFLKVEEEERGKEKETASLPTSVKTTLTIQATEEKRVKDFVDAAYQWHLSEQLAMQLKNRYRYMYEMIPSEEEASKRSYRRYKLSDEKSFQSLFFPQKDTLVQLLDHFRHRTGKYAIPGYPHKLGLLLHGPPGTGKTSLIKVLAQHTGRSIVNVPLARIKTNTELMQLIFDQKYIVEGIENPVRLRIKDVIFVMEDVDAVSNIVHRRDEMSDDKKVEALLSRENFDRIERLERLQKLAKKLEGDEAKKGKMDSKETKASSAADTQEGEEKRTKEVDEQLFDNMMDIIKKSETSSGMVGFGPGGNGASAGGKDELNLAGILNTLDGVVDTPGRMLVMTSNHPEKLDLALIRPGRIDKMFHLSYMVGEQACKMVSHYFQEELSAEVQQHIIALIDGSPTTKALEITPARLEQLCAEHEEPHDLCNALQALSTDVQVPQLTRAGSIDVEQTMRRTWTEPPKASSPPQEAKKAEVNLPTSKAGNVARW
eukprot:TRINITY_DN33538_c0_g1_i1.p1 TRINITY_DN33538_c0_g1~~TRINITY_DN33538_c0_g1_i1.p1  ORF type:complete len:670 (-),score=132.54 TRINITY_DN33538_c0_g1_i1:203-2179(-)